MERQLCSLGIEYAEGIEFAKVIRLPNGREIHKTKTGYETQPYNDNYWKSFNNLIDAVKFAQGMK
jgi:hypothetical protein